LVDGGPVVEGFLCVPSSCEVSGLDIGHCGVDEGGVVDEPDSLMGGMPGACEVLAVDSDEGVHGWG
jgi:hypothetical protein